MFENTYPVIFNNCYGGYGYSDAFKEYLTEHPEIRNGHDDDRTNLAIIELLKIRGSQWISSPYAKLDIDYVPVEYGYEIEEYDGAETIVYTPKVSKLMEIFNTGTAMDLLNYLDPTVVIENDNDSEW